MSWGFEIGRVYNRRVDIHARFGGQQQGGIITPAQHPAVIIITGEEGLQHGYADRYRTAQSPELLSDFGNRCPRK
jgi:5-methylcytosine-specific restriction protein A